MSSRWPSHAVAVLLAVAALATGACAGQSPTSDPEPRLISTHRPVSDPAPAPSPVTTEPSSESGDTKIGLRDHVTITVSD